MIRPILYRLSRPSSSTSRLITTAAYPPPTLNPATPPALAVPKIQSKPTSIKKVKALLQTLPKPTVSESEFTESFLRGSGPGGQKINKTSSAVQLKHIPTGIVIKSQATRSRTQNRKIARQLLAEKLDVLEKGEGSRVVIKGEVKKRRKASRAKKARRKYRALAEKDDGEELAEEDYEGDQKG